MTALALCKDGTYYKYLRHGVLGIDLANGIDYGALHVDGVSSEEGAHRVLAVVLLS